MQRRNGTENGRDMPAPSRPWALDETFERMRKEWSWNFVHWKRYESVKISGGRRRRMLSSREVLARRKSESHQFWCHAKDGGTDRFHSGQQSGDCSGSSKMPSFSVRSRTKLVSTPAPSPLTKPITFGNELRTDGTVISSIKCIAKGMATKNRAHRFVSRRCKPRAKKWAFLGRRGRFARWLALSGIEKKMASIKPGLKCWQLWWRLSDTKKNFVRPTSTLELPPWTASMKDWETKRDLCTSKMHPKEDGKLQKQNVKKEKNSKRRLYPTQVFETKKNPRMGPACIAPWYPILNMYWKPFWLATQPRGVRTGLIT